MPNDDILTDDYVAELLAKDAKESSIKYSALGLEAFAKSRFVSCEAKFHAANWVDLLRISQSQILGSFET
jgi:hypothetical protein